MKHQDRAIPGNDDVPPAATIKQPPKLERRLAVHHLPMSSPQPLLLATSFAPTR